MTNFYSIQFLVFLVAALGCYYIVFKKKQWMCLFVFSIIFYCFCGVENFIFLLLTGFSTWLGARQLGRYSVELKAVKQEKSLEREVKVKKKEEIMRKRRWIMWGVVLLNFGILSYLKYVRVIIENIAGLTGLQLQNTAVYKNVLGLVLPLGISFYMFQSIGYLLDVYNEKYEPERNFAKYFLFTSYFPQMIQGPINRYDVMREQFVKQYIWDSKQAVQAVYQIGYGLFKKYAVANILSGMIVRIFDASVKDYAGVTVAVGILLYSAQQYADFSGGIDMVRGVSELFGIKMAENFKQPYFSVSLGEFWRRWHMSLGKWMRDYVFYPFALTKPMKKMGKWANKKLGKHFGRILPAALGNMLVFFIVGIWHGAQWHYIIWGLYNGFVIALSDILAPLFEKVTVLLHLNTKTRGYRLFQIVRTFLIVNIGWYFDRIEDVKIALYSLKKTVFQFHAGLLKAEWKIVTDGYQSYAILLAVIGCMVIFVISLLKEQGVDVKEAVYRLPIVVRWMLYLFFIGMILISSMCVESSGGFMYANF